MKNGVETFSEKYNFYIRGTVFKEVATTHESFFALILSLEGV